MIAALRTRALTRSRANPGCAAQPPTLPSSSAQQGAMLACTRPTRHSAFGAPRDLRLSCLWSLSCVARPPGMRAWGLIARYSNAQWQVSPPPTYALVDVRLTVVGRYVDRLRVTTKKTKRETVENVKRTRKTGLIARLRGTERRELCVLDHSPNLIT